MSSNTPNLNLYKSAPAENVDEILQFSNNYDLIDVPPGDPNVLRRIQTRSYDFGASPLSLGLKSAVTDLTQFAANPFSYKNQADIKYRLKAWLYTSGDDYSRFRPHLYMQNGQSFSYESLVSTSTSILTLPKLVEHPAIIGGAVQSSVEADTVLTNQIDQASGDWTATSSNLTGMSIAQNGSSANVSGSIQFSGDTSLVFKQTTATVFSECENPIVPGDRVVLMMDVSNYNPSALVGSYGKLTWYNGATQLSTTSITFPSGTVAGSGGNAILTSSATAITVPTGADRVVVELSLASASYSPGTSIIMIINAAGLFKGTANPTTGIFSMNDEDLTNKGHYVLARDDINANKKIARIYGLNQWVPNVCDGGNALTVVDGIISPYPGGVADPDIAKFPLGLLREHNNGGVPKLAKYFVILEEI